MSNLTFVSKLLERVVCNQMTDFLEANDALPVTQSAYRRFDSTESALVKVYSDLCMAGGHTEPGARFTSGAIGSERSI